MWWAASTARLWSIPETPGGALEVRARPVHDGAAWEYAWVRNGDETLLIYSIVVLVDTSIVTNMGTIHLYREGGKTQHRLSYPGGPYRAETD